MMSSLYSWFFFFSFYMPKHISQWITHTNTNKHAHTFFLGLLYKYQAWVMWYEACVSDRGSWRCLCVCFSFPTGPFCARARSISEQCCVAVGWRVCVSVSLCRGRFCSIIIKMGQITATHHLASKGLSHIVQIQVSNILSCLVFVIIWR